MFSALLFGAGGTMLSEDESKVTFNGPEGQKAVEVLDRMVKEGGLPVLTKQAGEQAFVAGKIGFAFQTTGALRNTIKNVGTKFDLRTAHIPLIDPVNGRLPTGGNAVVILTKGRRQAGCGMGVCQVRRWPLWRIGRRSRHRLCSEQ